MTVKQERRFYTDMEDPTKQERYIKFVEAEEARYKAQREEDNGDD